MTVQAVFTPPAALEAVTRRRVRSPEAGDRPWLLGPAVLALTAYAVAQPQARLDLPDVPDDVLREQVELDAGAWRSPAPDPIELRPPPRVERSRVELGWDYSAYERERRSSRATPTRRRNFDQSGVQAPTQFRFSW